MKRILCFALCVLTELTAFSQSSDSLMTLKEVHITSSRFEKFRIGFQSYTIDSQVRQHLYAQNLSELISMTTPITIRSYGYGNIATASSRGSGAEHTAVLWNGFNMQSPILGLFDFSMYPVEQADEIDVQMGGNGALFGSGAIGGAIVLQSKPKFEKGIHADMRVLTGSFATQRYSLGIRTGTKKYETRFRFIRMEADNNFEYQNTTQPSLPIAKMQHAHVEQNVLTNDHFILLPSNQQLRFHLWLQESKREIPPVLGETVSVAEQDDQSIRLSGEWNKRSNRNSIALRSALFDERIHYTNTNTAIDSRSRALSSISEGEWTHKWNDFMETLTGLNHTQTHATNSGYGFGNKSIYRTAGFYSIKLGYRKWTAQHTGRTELYQSKQTPFIPTIGLQFKPIKPLTLSAGYSHSYRIPTLNEMYWTPGGNRNLKPESGRGAEVGITFSNQIGPLTFTHTSTLFYRYLENQIIWISANGNPSPFNLKETAASGIENQLQFSIPLGAHIRLSGASGIHYTQAKNLIAISPNDASENKYLIYVPRITQQHRISLQSKVISIMYLHTYTGMRYTTTDNSEALDAYPLANFTAVVKFSVLKVNGSIQTSILNLYNQSYQVMADRPMPGRHYQITLTLSI